MPTREVFRRDWPAFFDSFSREHHRWLVTIEVLSSELGAQREVEEVPLEGISAELKSPGTDIISITAGTGPARVTRHVAGAARVMLDQTEDGADEALQIETPDGPKTLVQFRTAIRAEMVDGMPGRTAPRAAS